MPTQRPKTPEAVDAEALRKYDDLADRFSAAVSLKTRVKDNTWTVKDDPDYEVFLLKILGWNPGWLSQKERNSGIPPSVVTEKSISPIPSKFKFHDDYCDIMKPLLALEFWEQISRAVELIEKTKDRTHAPIKCSTTSYCHKLTEETRRSRSPPRCPRLTVTLEGIVSGKDYHLHNYPDYGDLVVVERKRGGIGTAKPFKIFAYVEEMDATEINRSTRYDKTLLRDVKDPPYAVLTYSLYIKPTHLWRMSAARSICTLQKIFYLRSNLRMIRALSYLPRSPLKHHILHTKFEDFKLSEISSSQPQSLVTQDQLNSRQLAAVMHVKDAVARELPKICLVQGPPGTGKSKVIVNLVTEMLYGKDRHYDNEKMRILVCAPSNTAVDEIVRRLLDVRKKIPELTHRFKIVRIGRTESMDSEIADKVSLQALVAKKMDPILGAIDKEIRYLKMKIKALQLPSKKAVPNEVDPDELSKILEENHFKLYSLIRRKQAVFKEMDQEKKTETSLLKEADVIACTLNSCYTNLMESTFGRGDGERASFCIVDEATQCVEAECLIPLMLGVRTLVLVGDTNQLPATVISQKAKKLGLDQSLFARIQKCFPTEEENPVIQLDTQYRMSPPVALWPNQFFYDDLLVNSAIVENLPFQYYKVFDHNATQNRDKFSNKNEAAFVVNLLYTLMTSSQLSEAKTPVTVGIITPYNNQKALIHKQIRECIDPLPADTISKMVYEVNTIDGFQGQERDIIIMSCVRSDGIGFLSDGHRLCVALTRAKHSVILCGNFKTFETNSMWKALLSDAKTRGVYLKIKATASSDEIQKHVFRSNEKGD